MLHPWRIYLAAIVIFFLFTSHSQAAVADAGQRQLTLLSDAPWQYAGSGAELPELGTPEFEKLDWETVQVPHVFQTRAQPTQIQQAWYRRAISIPPEDKGKRLYLRFEGAAAVATVYVNGKLLGDHHGAYTAFIFDATDALHVGDDNSVAVRVDDRAASTKDCLPNGSRLYKVWGGLYRKVWLIATDPLHVDPTDSPPRASTSRQPRLQPTELISRSKCFYRINRRRPLRQTCVQRCSIQQEVRFRC
jgi:hypothetical protein